MSWTATPRDRQQTNWAIGTKPDGSLKYITGDTHHVHGSYKDGTYDGCVIPKYNINFIVNPQETKSVTFKADQPRAYWIYCTHFCHALHLEMRSRFLVEA